MKPSQPAATGDLIVPRELLDCLPDGIVLKDGSGRITYANRAMLTIYGIRESQAIGRTDLELARINPLMSDSFKRNFETDEIAWSSAEPSRFQNVYDIRGPGEQTWEVIKTPFYDAQGGRSRMVVLTRDITECVRISTELRASERTYRLIAENMKEMIGVCDLNGRLTYVSPSVETVLRLPSSQSHLGTLAFSLTHPADIGRVKACLWMMLNRERDHMTVEYRCEDGLGRYVWLETTLTFVEGRDRAGEILMVSRDISERQQLEQELQAMAYEDPLTRMANRRRLMDTINMEIARAKRYGKEFGLLYLDIDNFKQINDSRGHQLGDKLLKEMTRRMRGVLRESDVLGRMGGDEFVIVLPSGHGAEQAELVANRLCHSLQEPWLLNDESLQTSSSIGVATYPACGETAKSLLQAADAALYRAKRAGRARVELSPGATH